LRERKEKEECGNVKEKVEKGEREKFLKSKNVKVKR
jgi:hypothetical protein